MTRADILIKVINLLTPYTPKAMHGALSESTNIVNDLGVNSARLVDIALELEEQFGVSVDDEAMDKMATIGDTVDLVAAQICDKMVAGHGTA